MRKCQYKIKEVIIIKKKMLILFASPHAEGHTKKMLSHFIGNVKLKYDIFFIDAFRKNAKPCIDCSYCKKYNKCSFNDLDEFYKNLTDADLIIIATPIYNLSFPAPLKAILDRTQIYYNTRNVNPIEKRKEVILLLTCGKNKKKYARIVEQQLKCVLFSINAKIKDTIIWQNTDANLSMPNKLYKEIERISRDI